MISTTRCRSFLLFAAFLLVPLRAFAAVQITEVMYDAPGSDQGHEWIEVTNMGSSTVDLAGWKFYTGGTNHNLAVAEGTTTLPAGASAIVANDPAQFVSDFPNYAGGIFKSSFSLPNTSAIVSIKDAKLHVVDSLSYSSKLGAAGDGNSLHLTAAGLVAGAPDPGMYTSTPPKPITKPAVAAAASQKTSSPSTKTNSSSHSAASAASQQTAITFQAGHELPLPQESPWLWYAVGAAAVIVLCLAGAVYVRLETSPKSETSKQAEEFDIE